MSFSHVHTLITLAAMQANSLFVKIFVLMDRGALAIKRDPHIYMSAYIYISVQEVWTPLSDLTM